MRPSKGKTDWEDRKIIYPEEIFSSILVSFPLDKFSSALSFMKTERKLAILHTVLSLPS
jgi:hypothetical protein